MHRVMIGIAILSFVAAQACFVAAAIDNLELVFEVNERVPEGERFEPLGWYPQKHLNFWKVRKQVLPNSPRAARVKRLAVAGFCLFFISIALYLLS